MTTENIFAHEKYIGATVWNGDTPLEIIAVNELGGELCVLTRDASGDKSCEWNDQGIGRFYAGYKHRLSWIKQDFVLGKPPKPKLKPLEFKGVPVLALVGTLDARKIERWVIGYKHGNFVCLNSSNHSFLEAIMNQDFSSGLINFIESKCAWEIPE